MPKIIYKYKLEVKHEQEIEMPIGSVILKVDTQLVREHTSSVMLQQFNGRVLEQKAYSEVEHIFIWCCCPTQSGLSKRKFIVVGTGVHFDDDGLKFVGSAVFKHTKLVYHIFEKPQPHKTEITEDEKG